MDLHKQGTEKQIVAISRVCEYVSGEISNDVKIEGESIIKVEWINFDQIKKENFIADEYESLKFLILEKN